jgi:hypothetical protein
MGSNPVLIRYLSYLIEFLGNEILDQSKNSVDDRSDLVQIYKLVALLLNTFLEGGTCADV